MSLKSLNDKQKKIYDRLVHSGCSEEFAGYVLKYPDSLIAENFLARGNLGGGHFFTFLWEGNIVKALQRADLKNYAKMKELLFPEDNNLNKVFCYIPASLRECKNKEECDWCGKKEN